MGGLLLERYRPRRLRYLFAGFILLVGVAWPRPGRCASPASEALTALVNDRAEEALGLLGDSGKTPADSFSSLVEAAAALASGQRDRAYTGFVAALGDQPGLAALGLAAWAAQGGREDLAGALIRDARQWPLPDQGAVDAAWEGARPSSPGRSSPTANPVSAVVLVSPGDGQSISGRAALYAADLSGSGGLYVSFHLNGRLVWGSTRPPFFALVDTSDLPPGPFRVEVVVQRGLVGETLGRAAVAPVRVADRPPVAEARSLSAAEGATLEQVLLRDLRPPRAPEVGPDGTSAAGFARDRSAAQLSGRGGRSQVAPPPSGTVSAPSRFSPRAGSVGQRAVALIFDDGPHPVITPAILEILRKKGVRASFFLVGIRAEAYPELVQAIAAGGHDIGNHSYSHRKLTTLSDAELTEEIAGNSRLLEDLSGRKVRFFRSPGGNFDPRVELAIRRANLVGLEHPYNTWGLMRLPVEAIVRKVADGVSDGDMILLHNGEDKSVFVLPRLIDALRARGFSFLTASEWFARQGGD